MARRSQKTSKSSSETERTGSARPSNAFENLIRTATMQGTGLTGRYVVVYRQHESKRGSRAMHELAGVKTINSKELEGSYPPPVEAEKTQVLMEKLDVAVTTLDAEQLDRVSLAHEDSAIEFVIPERIIYLSTEALRPGMIAHSLPLSPLGIPGAMSAPMGGLEYWYGYRDGINAVLNGLIGQGAPQGLVPGSPPGPSFQPQGVKATLSGFEMPWLPVSAFEALSQFTEEEATWGLQATDVMNSNYSGDGIKVAILDTGLDLDHPDFQDGRVVETHSFVDEPFGDVITPRSALGPGNPGHGTHCVGTACGPREPGSGPRYGIAYNAQIVVGKVFSNYGATVDGAITDALEWAISEGCRVVSMSLGAPANPFGSPSPLYEKLGRRALENGTVVIAAAGNRSRRKQGYFAPVDSPADSMTIMSVGAVDEMFRVADFSARARFKPHGDVDIAGPGVNIYSSLPLPAQYGRLQGTSMATPHVAGIAALLMEARPEWTARQILNALMQMATKIPQEKNDVGAGLVLCP